MSDRQIYCVAYKSNSPTEDRVRASVFKAFFDIEARRLAATILAEKNATTGTLYRIAPDGAAENRWRKIGEIDTKSR